MTLTGSDKQITWAEQIRTTWLAHAERMLATTCRPERAAKNPMIAADRELGLRAVEAAPTVDSASFWIDNRFTFERGDLRLGVGAGLVLEQTARQER